jgi:hypothetical protein
MPCRVLLRPASDPLRNPAHATRPTASRGAGDPAWGKRRVMLIIFMLIRANRHSCQGMNVRRKIVQRAGF